MKLKRLRLTGTIIMICAIIVTLQAASSAAQEASISVEPTYTEVWQGDEFTVDITVDPAENEIYGASYTLYFNNTLLNATSQVKGPFLTQDGLSSIIYTPPTGINNSIGQVEYVESRTGNVSGVIDPGVLTTVTFQVIGEEGISSLNLCDSDGMLLSSCPPTAESIPTTVNNGRVGIAQTVQTQSPFVISGYVSCENGSDCNYPAVNITNLNIGKEWAAVTAESSNYYQLALESCADVIVGEILQFDATSSDGSQSNTTEHTVTQAEVDAGGFKYNVTLKRPPGDINGDGETNSADVAIALRMAVCGEYNTIADVNRDNSVTSLDALMIMQSAEEL